MPQEVIAAIIGAVLGGIFTDAITAFTILIQQKRRILEYEIFSMPLLRFKPKADSPLIVTTDK